MLERLLSVLNRGGTHRLQDLADELGVSVELVESMLDGLLRLGYLQRVQAMCGSSCQGCGQRSACVAGCGGKVWTLSERGRRMAQ